MSEYISKEKFVSHYRALLCEDCKHRKQYRNGKLINRFVYEIGGPPCRACEIDDMLDRVEDFEPADVAPVKRGKWIKSRQFAYTRYTSVFTCSECNKSGKSNYNYCHNCGVRLEANE